jgi:hypothetical protein
MGWISVHGKQATRRKREIRRRCIVRGEQINKESISLSHLRKLKQLGTRHHYHPQQKSEKKIRKKKIRKKKTRKNTKYTYLSRTKAFGILCMPDTI